MRWIFTAIALGLCGLINMSIVLADYIFFAPPPNEHPRLFLRRENISELNQKMFDPDIQAQWLMLLTDSQIEQDGKDPINTAGGLREDLVRSVEANAMLYLLKNDRVSGEKAIKMTLNMLDNWVRPTAIDPERHSGRMILTAAICYDWCYDLLTAAQRDRIIDMIKYLATELDCGYPVESKGFLTGKSSEAQVLRDVLAASVAVYDELPALYQDTLELLNQGYFPAKNFYYQSHASNQGESYGAYRFQWDVFANWIFKRMGYDNVFSEHQGFVPYRWLYTRRPDGQLIREGDSALSSKFKMGDYFNFTSTILLASSYYNDGFLQSEFLRQNRKGYIDISPIWTLLFYQPDLESQDLSKLPLTKYFPSPGGYMTARTGWEMGVESDDVVVDMKIGEYQYNNHQHLDSGAFQIYYKGALAIDSGIYQGQNGGYGSAHDINYNKRTIAHNCMIVFDENEVFSYKSADVANDGGQYFPMQGQEPYALSGLQSGYKVASVQSAAFGPDSVKPFYSHIKGDLTSAYSSKISNYVRSFVFMNLDNKTNPAALIVFDRLESTDASFPKKWLLHSIEEPTVADGVVTIVRTEGEYNGKLITTPLLPKADNLVIDKIGGEGQEFLVNGVNYQQLASYNNSSEEPGAWRIEIGTSSNATTDCFLNVLQVMDYDTTDLPLEVSLIESQLMLGAMVGDSVVLFSKNGECVSDSFVLQANHTTTRFILTDMASGMWRIQDNNGIMTESESQEGENTIYFTGSGTEYTISKI